LNYRLPYDIIYLLANFKYIADRYGGGQMWYEEAIREQPQEVTVSRKDIFDLLHDCRPEISQNSLKWIISELLDRKLLYRIGYNTYSYRKPEGKIMYSPIYSGKSREVQETVEREYPLVDFCIFESFLLNEFLNHQVAQNTILIQIEKEIGSFLFEYLEESYEGRILYRPNMESYGRYWRENCIIIIDKVSEAPKDRENPHAIVLEKLLVDIFAEPMVRCLFSHSEYPLIMETARERYLIDEKRMMRYARRRNAVTKMKEYMGRV